MRLDQLGDVAGFEDQIENYHQVGKNKRADIPRGVRYKRVYCAHYSNVRSAHPEGLDPYLACLCSLVGPRS